MPLSPQPRTPGAVTALVLVLACGLAVNAGCADTVEAAGEVALDFRGNYSIVHEEQVSVSLVLGGKEYNEDGIQGQTIVAGGVEIDMGYLCDSDGITCPSEIYWPSIAIDQPFFDARPGENPWLIQIVNQSHLADQLKVGGLVSPLGSMTMDLSMAPSDDPECAFLPPSVLTAEFELDAEGAPTGRLLDGFIKTFYAGECLFPRNPAYEGSTVSFQTAFSGERVGALNLLESVGDPPAFDENGQPL